MPEGWTAINVGDIEKYNGQDGSTTYKVTKNGDGSITISHDGAMGKYASCSFKPNFGENNTLYTKITNNSDVAATVQVQVNKAGTEANDYQPTPTVTAVYVNKEKQSDASEYSVELKIDANTSVVIANMFDTAKSPDTVAISLNSQENVAGKVEKGNITLSGISMKKITDESELGTSKDDDTENKEPEQNDGEGTTPTPTDIPEDAIAIDLSKLDSWWSEGFEVSDKTDSSATIKVTENAENYEQYAKMCGLAMTFIENNRVSLKVKNNDTKDAYVKIDIKNDTNGSAVTTATVNGKDADVQYGGADTTISANKEVVFVFTLDTSKEADKFIVGLNNNGESAPTSGNITISDAYMWKE